MLNRYEARFARPLLDGGFVFDLEAWRSAGHQVIAVHSGDPHADDVVSAALLALAASPDLSFPDTVEIRRTRNPHELADAVRLDVGEGAFDHHGRRSEPGVAAITRISKALWQGSGRDVVFRRLLQMLTPDFQVIADGDTAVDIRPGRFSGVTTRLQRSGSPDARFQDGLDLAITLIQDCHDLIQEQIGEEQDAEQWLLGHPGKVVVMDRFNRASRKIAWKLGHAARWLISESRGEWRALSAARPGQQYRPFDSWSLFPASWRGLREDALVRASGIPGGIFVHPDGHSGAWDSQEHARMACERALEQYN